MIEKELLEIEVDVQTKDDFENLADACKLTHAQFLDMLLTFYACSEAISEGDER